MSQKRRSSQRKNTKKNPCATAKIADAPRTQSHDMEIWGVADNLDWYLHRGLINERQYNNARSFRIGWEMRKSHGIRSYLASYGSSRTLDEDYVERMASRLDKLLRHPDVSAEHKSCLINIAGFGQSAAAWVRDYFVDRGGRHPSRRGMTLFRQSLDLADAIWSRKMPRSYAKKAQKIPRFAEIIP